MAMPTIVPLGQESSGQQPRTNYRRQDHHDEGRHKAFDEENGHSERYRKQHRPEQRRKPRHSVLIQHFFTPPSGCGSKMCATNLTAR